MIRMRSVLTLALVCLLPFAGLCLEYHVSKKGSDRLEGTLRAPLLTIQAAARLAMPGDTITVHAGIYRERIDPPRGGASEQQRMLYRAAPGERVVIKGSEVITSWRRLPSGLWRVTLPNSFFGAYNPYADVVGTDWYDNFGRDLHTGEVYLNDKSLYEVSTLDSLLNPQPLPRTLDPAGSRYVWHTSVGADSTTISANFQDADPNAALTEINVREACFYPSLPGMNYITVRGFVMSQAACQWSTATDEQNGLIGTHWSKGWVIENNEVSHAKNIGIALGKDRKSGHRSWSAAGPNANGYVVYNEVVLRALLESNWDREHIGSHIVRNNVIHDCEKNGIHGSLGGVFSRIENNHIYDIYTKRQYFGWDIGGIKFLGGIDILIEGNRIHNTFVGIWLDWMAQGTRVTRNVLYDNDDEDFFIEVNHGPYVIDNNVSLSKVSLLDMSQGGAYAHNLFAGKITLKPVADRKTPYHEPHGTMIAGFKEILGGDNRFYNNVFAGDGLAVYDTAALPMHVSHNVYLGEAKPYFREIKPSVRAGSKTDAQVEARGGQGYLVLDLGSEAWIGGGALVSTATLGKAFVPGLPFYDFDGRDLKVDYDVLGVFRQVLPVTAGPFQGLKGGVGEYRIW